MSDPVLPEHELLQRLRAGDHAALESIFHTYRPHLVRLAGSIVREPMAAEDIAQDVLLELWRRREELMLDTSLRAYLLRAARNRALNHLRHRRTVARADPAELPFGAAPRPDRELVEKEMEAALQEAVNDLAPRCREAFELSRVHGLKYAEIATVMNISIKSVETQIGRALQSLRKRLAAWLPEAPDM